MRSHGTQSFWRTIRNVFGTNNSTDKVVLKKDGELITDSLHIAEEFVHFFDRKVKDLLLTSKVEQHDHNTVNCGPHELWQEFSLSEVRTSFHSLKNKRSTGHDDLPMCFIKDCKEVLSQHLTVLFNGMVSSNWFPDEWKIAKVKPIH